ncbi:MAG: PDZ domain-containing protein [Alphaproteobacteria bacterium]|nr:PDZ domain-containing protein [Alphaproteobacteria bacterium]MCB9792934.1 PDZ domain-containing protein [Alphaproteobacteria bacterium]
MRRIPRPLRDLLPLLGLGTLVSWPAVAQAPTDIIDAALSRISTLYLDRDTLRVEQICSALAERLEIEIEWLMVDVDGCALTLTRGGDEPLGTTVIVDQPDLGRALAELSARIEAAESPEDLAHTLDGVALDVVMLKGVTDALDRHSRVLYGERLRAFDKRLKGTFHGVGLTLEDREKGAFILEEVFPGHPAAEAGLKPGDQLLRIDGVSLVGLDVQAVGERLSGEEGSAVELELRRGASAPFTVELIREEIRVPNVRHRALDGGFGYVRIEHFSELTSDHLDRALSELKEAGALDRGLVLDLRDNTGGSMLQSARSVDAFVTAGDLLRTVGPDGGRVRGLAERIWADDDGTEPQVPIVVLQNRRTASGAEILAGSLRELDRAVIIGDRSYGKGTVQKVYTLDEDTRLKLTVARYLLAGGVSIADVGIAPDLPVGRVELTADGVKLLSPGDHGEGIEPVLFVHEAEGWRDDEPPPPERADIPLELALRVLASTAGLSRHQLLAASGEVRELARAEEEQRIAQAFEAKGLSWQPAPSAAGRPEVSLELSLAEDARAGFPAEVIARVENTGAAPLYQGMLSLSSADSTWDGLVLPLGYVAPGEVVERRTSAYPFIGAATRESLTYAVLEADLRPTIALGGQVLGYTGHAPPDLSLDLRLEPEGEAHRAVIGIKQEGLYALSGVRVRFEVPESVPLELDTPDAGLPSLAPGEEAELHLGLTLFDEGDLPLHVIVESERYGQLVDWAFVLPRDGSEVHLDAPRVLTPGLPSSAEVGPLKQSLRVSDDRAVDHLVVWQGRDKVRYQQGEGKRLDAELTLDVQPGENRFLIEAIDDQGLRTRSYLYVNGLQERALAAEDEAP